MNKRLTVQEMEEMLTWLEYQDELSGLVSKLVSSEKAAWEEVERLKGQLQDALYVMQVTVNDIDCYYPQISLIALKAAIQRIQGESEQNE